MEDATFRQGQDGERWFWDSGFYMNKKESVWAMVAVGIFAGGILMLGAVVPVKKVNRWNCALTGSGKGSVIWLGYLTVSDWHQASPIERWLADNNRQIERNWVRTQGTSCSLFGVATARRHGRAPAVMGFPAELQERFLLTASTEEVETFLELLRNGDQDKIQEEVDRLNEKIMEDM